MESFFRFIPLLIFYISLEAHADLVFTPTKDVINTKKSNSRVTIEPSSRALVESRKAKEVVCSSNSPNSALVVIDMQPYFAIRNGQHNDFENKAKIGKIIEMQIESIKKAIEANVPIVFMEYDCSECDPTESKLKSAVANYSNVRFIKKDTDGMFDNYNNYRRELVNFIKKYDIGTLIITGANGGACVLESIKGALDNNCNVVAFSGGIADFNYKDFIYPYVGQYSNLKPTCKDCSFKEVALVEKVADYMVHYPRAEVNGSQNTSNMGSAR